MGMNVNFNARLGRNAEIKQTQGGTQYVSVPCATDVFINGNNETMWINVTDFSDRTLKIAQYLTKGKLVNICGEYFDRIYTNKNNEPQIGRDVRAFKIDFVSSGQQNAENTNTSSTQQNTQNDNVAMSIPQMPQMSMSVSSSDDNDDLPF